MTGTITKRGKKSWRIQYDLPRDENGERRIAYATIRGTRKDAEKALRAKLSAIDAGTHVDPSKLTVGGFLDNWLTTAAPLTAKARTLERYQEFVRLQIKPHLGDVKLQALRPKHMTDWHQALIDEGRLAPSTIAAAHGALRTAIAHAVKTEILARNVAKIISPPKVEKDEVVSLTEDQVADVLDKLSGDPVYPIAAVAIGTGARRGEIAALTWADIDLDAKVMKIRRSLEQTKKYGIRVKAPKSKAGKRTISLPALAVDALREHRIKTLELRMVLGAGALPADAPVFATIEGEWPSPDGITDQWRAAVKRLDLPKIRFHALRHSHASALIAAGLDVITISRRLGHSKASITLDVYGHLFTENDTAAADAIDAIF
jgi:integrase